MPLRTIVREAGITRGQSPKGWSVHGYIRGRITRGQSLRQHWSLTAGHEMRGQSPKGCTRGQSLRQH